MKFTYNLIKKIGGIDLKENCEYRATNSGKCYFGPKKKNNSDEIHIGTENKIQFIESYVEGWINKLLNGP